MAVQICSKEFGAGRNISCYAYEKDEDVRKRVLEKCNEFFFAHDRHDSIDIVNIVEDWTEGGEFLKLIVYYKL